MVVYNLMACSMQTSFQPPYPQIDLPRCPDAERKKKKKVFLHQMSPDPPGTNEDTNNPQQPPTQGSSPPHATLFARSLH